MTAEDIAFLADLRRKALAQKPFAALADQARLLEIVQRQDAELAELLAQLGNGRTVGRPDRTI